MRVKPVIWLLVVAAVLIATEVRLAREEFVRGEMPRLPVFDLRVR